MASRSTAPRSGGSTTPAGRTRSAGTPGSGPRTSAHVARARVDVDREVEEVAHREVRGALGGGPGGLQDVEPLHDEHVGALHHDLAPREDVVGQVVVHGYPDLGATGLDLGDEAQERPAVVGLREALAVHQPATLELRVGVEEAVGGDQLDARGRGPAREQLAQQAGRGRLADRHRAGDADDERGPADVLAQERARRRVQAAGGLDVQVEQTGDRPVDRVDLGQVDRVAETGEALHVRVGQGQRGGRGEPRPGVAVQVDVGRGRGQRRWHGDDGAERGERRTGGPPSTPVDSPPCVESSGTSVAR